jgi:hypothetical protein
MSVADKPFVVHFYFLPVHFDCSYQNNVSFFLNQFYLVVFLNTMKM